MASAIAWFTPSGIVCRPDRSTTPAMPHIRRFLCHPWIGAWERSWYVPELLPALQRYLIQFVNATSDKAINQTRKKSVDSEHPTGFSAENRFRPVPSQSLEHGGSNIVGRHAALKINFHSAVIAKQMPWQIALSKS